MGDTSSPPAANSQVNSECSQNSDIPGPFGWSLGEWRAARAWAERNGHVSTETVLPQRTPGEKWVDITPWYRLKHAWCAAHPSVKSPQDMEAAR